MGWPKKPTKQQHLAIEKAHKNELLEANLVKKMAIDGAINIDRIRRTSSIRSRFLAHGLDFL